MSKGGQILHKAKILSKRFLPDFIINSIRFPGRLLRSRRKNTQRKMSELISCERLVADLRKSGIV
ncbi:MAG: hypothetical protein ABIJ45_09820, partial [Candidatus Zixiibacteriota bacterium]